jgi:hypothetical protein
MNPNLEKGKRAERAVAKYFRDHGCCSAERRVSTGWRNNIRENSDMGDVKNIPGICVQVKDHIKTGPLTGKMLDQCLADTRAQTAASDAMIPLLVEKRRTSDVGRWYAWLPQWAFLVVSAGSTAPMTAYEDYPVRVELQYVITPLVTFSQHYADQAA